MNGQLYGLRQWALIDGQLTGFHGTVWDPTEVMVARCLSNSEEHPPADPECTCGIYGYTDIDSFEANQDFRNSPHTVVTGLIKAYGYVTQGTKGFRAGKAEIVAVSDRLLSLANDDVERRAASPLLQSLNSANVRIYPDTDTLYRNSEPLLEETRRG